MAIQKVNLAVPNGDTPRSANTKINENFSTISHAASRTVGEGLYQVPDGFSIYLSSAMNKPVYAENQANSGVNCNDFDAGTINYIDATGNITNAPNDFGNNYWVIETHKQSGNANTEYQIARASNSSYVAYRRKSNSGEYTTWEQMTQTKRTYIRTTAAGANVVVDSGGGLSRSTSSERYKDILAPLVLDDTRYAEAMALNPIVYRSTADADNPLHHYYSFSAEELGSYDPAFTLWRTTETITDADGITTEQPLAEKQAEGININALLAMSHAIAIKQDKLIKALEARIAALEPKKGA